MKINKPHLLCQLYSETPLDFRMIHANQLSLPTVLWKHYQLNIGIYKTDTSSVNCMLKPLQSELWHNSGTSVQFYHFLIKWTYKPNNICFNWTDNVFLVFPVWRSLHEYELMMMTKMFKTWLLHVRFVPCILVTFFIIFCSEISLVNTEFHQTEAYLYWIKNIALLIIHFFLVN